MRAFLIVYFYASALLLIWCGVELAPELSRGFPETARQIGAASLLTIGCISKLIGHWLLLFPSR